MSQVLEAAPIQATESDAARIRPGRYRLTVDVANPALDRRTRHDWRTVTPTLRAGDLFDVFEGNYSATFNDHTNHQWEIGLVGRKFEYQRLTVFSMEERPTPQELKDDPVRKLAWDLLPHLERIDDNLVRKEVVAKAKKAADNAAAKADLVSYTAVCKAVSDLLELKPTLLAAINDGTDEGAELARLLKAIRKQEVEA
ncbi:MAG: hypothetical protein O9327_02325 [Polaromonas sp.]|nr:hypothetical protein [Polaromonas sp.]